MKKLILKDVKILEQHFERLDVLLNDDRSLALLPTLFSIFCFSRSIAYITREVRTEDLASTVRRETFIQEHSITQSTCVTYVARVFEFAKYCDQLEESFVDINSDRLMNRYLNESLGKRVTSIATVEVAKSALSAYRLFLLKLDLGDLPNLNLRSEIIANLNSATIVHSATDYVSREERTIIKQACSNDRDRLIIRCGYQLGLRSSENRALLLTDQYIKGVRQPGLLSLFKKADNETSEVFAYTLNGVYTKFKKSRVIYIPRQLLLDFYDYYKNERRYYTQKSNEKREGKHLFIRYDSAGKGEAISDRHATNIFLKARKNSILKEAPISYHKLRHTFATEYFATLIKDKSGQYYSEANALYLVGKRLGHANPSTTSRYVRLLEDLKIKENIEL